MIEEEFPLKRKQEKHKVFIDSVFANEAKQKEVIKHSQAQMSIDLAANPKVNFLRFVEFPVPKSQETSYRFRLSEAAEQSTTLTPAQIKGIVNVLLNTEQLLFKLVSDYYGQQQLDAVSHHLIETTLSYEQVIVKIMDDSFEMTKAFRDVSHSAGVNLITNQLNHTYGQTVPSEVLTIHYILQDMMQFYIDQITDSSLRTDMISFSQFSYQLALLAKNASEVLCVLYRKFKRSD